MTAASHKARPWRLSIEPVGSGTLFGGDSLGIFNDARQCLDRLERIPPAAVSPASMIASAPSSTALAASLTSARVGRGDPASTRAPASRQSPGDRGPGRRDDLLLNARNLLERHLEPEVAARDHHAMHLAENGIQVLERRRPLDLRDDGTLRPASAINCFALATSAAVCTKLMATKSTPSARPNRRSASSLSVIHDAGKRTPGALIPLCSPSGPPVTTTVVNWPSAAPVTRSSIFPSSSSSRSPGRADRINSTNVVETRPGPPTSSPGTIRSCSPFTEGDRPTAGERAGSNFRPAEILHDGHSSPGPARDLANRSVHRRVRVVRAVRKVEAKEIDAGQQQRFEHLRAVRCRTDRRNHFGVPHAGLKRTPKGQPALW